MHRYLHIRTSKFPILEGEEEEIVNPGTYGKAFAEYIAAALTAAGYQVPFVCCEDWGWWVEVKLPAKPIGIICKREHDSDGECGFGCTTSPDQPKVWSWSRLRHVDLGPDLEKIHSTLRDAFMADPEIKYLGESVGACLDNLKRMFRDLEEDSEGRNSLQHQLLDAILILRHTRDKDGWCNWNDSYHDHTDTLHTWLTRQDPSGRIARDIQVVKNSGDSGKDFADLELYRLSSDVYLWCLARPEPILLPQNYDFWSEVPPMSIP